MADKVKFGIKNVHVFPITAWNDGVPTYGNVRRQNYALSSCKGYGYSHCSRRKANGILPKTLVRGIGV